MPATWQQSWLIWSPRRHYNSLIIVTSKIPLDLPGIRSHRLWTPPHHSLERWALGAEIFPQRLDLFHSTDFIPPAWGARNYVITVHDLNFLHYPQYLTAESRRYYNEQIEWAVARADAIIADSYATQRDLEQLLGVRPERIKVVHLAADPVFQPLPPAEVERALARHDLKSGYLLFVGTWEPRKNLPALLQALAILRAGGDNCRLVIAGRPGWLYEEIFALIEQLGLEPWVHFLEDVSLADLIALYNGAALLALPSFYEGFGLPALEAMQCGTPTVVADRASLPEVVGEAGLFIDPEAPETLAQACQRLLHDGELHAELRQAGFRQASQFTWQATAEQTLRVYADLLASA